MLPFLDRKRRITTPVSPFDKSTVVSIFPKKIHEVKHTIQPGIFDIGAGTYDKPAVLVVGPSSWWRDIPEDDSIIEIPTSSVQIANSIVVDYANGLLGCNMGDHMPGIFFIPGIALTSDEVKSKHKKELDSAREKQRNWFALLVRMADSLWATSNGNPRSISDDARLAARELNITNKDWLSDAQVMEMVRCVACGALRNPLYPICATCKAIADPELAKKHGLQFAS